jgi:redox-sensitive bicupin YhaK (pirin superfamily)
MLVDTDGILGRHTLHSDSPVISNFVEGMIVGAVSGYGEVHSKRALGLNPKPRHFKPFEYFDHTTYDPIVAPARIFPRHLHHQAFCFLI